MIRQFSGRKISDIFTRALNSTEFDRKILQPLISGETIWGPYRGRTDFSDLRRWATDVLPVGADFWAKLPPGAGWEQFYLALLLDIRTRDLSPKLRDPDIRKALESRRLNNGPGAIRDLVGHIDHVNIWEVRGWCGDEAGAGEDLVIEIFVDTIFVGTVSCDQLRPDVQRLLGGNGIYGFTFSFSASHLDLFQVDRWISAREQTTKRTFGRILFPRSSHPERIDHLARLHRELEQIRTVLDRIEAELPEQARQFSFPLSAYSEYFAAYVTVYRGAGDGLSEPLGRSAVPSGGIHHAVR